MPIANSYTPQPAPWIGPVVSNTVPIVPGVATGTNPIEPPHVPPTIDPVPVKPGVATGTNPPPPPPFVPSSTPADVVISNVTFTVADLSNTVTATSNFVVQGNSITIVNNPSVLNFIGSGVSTTSGGNGIVNITINSTSTRSAGMRYAVQYAGANGLFDATSNFAFDPVNKMVKIGIAQLNEPYDLNLNGNLIVGQIHSQTGAQPFGAGYAEFGRIRYIDDAGYANAGYPSVYGFRQVPGEPNIYENWMCVVNEPGHEADTSTALVMGQGRPNGASTLFGISVNNTNPRGSNTRGIYSEPSASGWKQILNLTGKDLFLPKLTEATGPKTLVYDPNDGRVSYTNGSAGSSINVQKEGANVVVGTNVFNFIGNGVYVANVNNVATVTIPGGIGVQSNGTNVILGTRMLNFVGSYVRVTEANSIATITFSDPGGVAVQSNGGLVLSATKTFNFTGNAVRTSNVSNVATVSINALQGVNVKSSGVDFVSLANAFNFVGSGVSVSNIAGVATINISGGGGIVVKKDGVTTVQVANILDFQGAGFSVVNNPNGTASISLANSTGGVQVRNQGNTIINVANTFNFIGNGVTASNVGGVATIRINSTGGNLGTNPYQLVFADANGIASSNPLLTIQNPTNNIDGGAALQIGASPYSTGGGNTTQGMLYFTDSTESSVYPYPSASIRYQYGGSTFDKGIKISPWYNYNGTTNFASGVGLGTWRRASQASTHGTKVTLNAGDTGAGVHGVYIGQGAIDFFPDYGTGNSSGLSYVILPAAFTANGATDRYVGQISVNAYKNPGVPQWSLGWKDSDPLNPNETNERIPGNRNIIWDSNNRVSINDANLTESFNVKGNIRIQATGANNGTGIKFADGTFQYTAATGGGGGAPGGDNPQLQFNNNGVFGGIPTVTYANIFGDRYLTVGGDSNLDAAVIFNYGNANNFGVIGVASSENNQPMVMGYAGANRSKVAVEPGENGNIIMALGTANGTIQMGAVENIEITGGSAGQVLTTAGDGNLSWTTVSGGGGGISTVQDEGSTVVTNATTINFVGSGVTATNVGGVATVTIPGGGGGGDTIYDLGNVTGTVNLNVNNGNIQTCTLTGNTYFNLAGVTSGQSITLIITQGPGGNKIATWSGRMRWASSYKTLSTAEAAIDMVNMVNVNYLYYATLTTGYTE